MADNIVFTASVAQAQQSLKALDGSLASTGKSIEGVKSTMEKIFAAQAIYTSASRVAEAIKEVTKELNAQTDAHLKIMKLNDSTSATYEQLSNAAEKARESAKKIREDNQSIGGMIGNIASYGSLSAASERADDIEREADAADFFHRGLDAFDGFSCACKRPVKSL